MSSRAIRAKLKQSLAMDLSRNPSGGLILHFPEPIATIGTIFNEIECSFIADAALRKGRRLKIAEKKLCRKNPKALLQLCAILSHLRQYGPIGHSTKLISKLERS